MGVCFWVFFFFHINRGLFAGREQSLPVEKNQDLFIQERSEGRGGRCHEVIGLNTQSGFVGTASGNDSFLEGYGHFHRVPGYGDGGIYQAGSGTHFHGFSGMTRCTYTGIHYHRHVALLDDDEQEVA